MALTVKVPGSKKGPAQIYAEEGYVAAVVETGGDTAAEQSASVDEVVKAAANLKTLSSITLRNIGIIGFGVGAAVVASAMSEIPDIGALVLYYPSIEDWSFVRFDNSDLSIVVQFAASEDQTRGYGDLAARYADQTHVSLYSYPSTSVGFALAGSPTFDKPASMMAYSRTLGCLRQQLGPRYDLAKIWEEHCLYEFGERDARKTMKTMVAEPYANHIPTMTGGVGHDHLLRFYTHHFVNSNPADTKLIPISQTVGVDRIVDEMLFCFTHDKEIDWLLPGVEPTGRYVEIPLVAIVNIRGDKLYNEHIYWDQASVLVQLGKLDPKGLPIAGIETAKKLLDPSLPSNTLMSRWRDSEGQPV
ncbi:hypothetical protein BZG36_00108 [Bifiguratus adelaidae]|uniref:Dienelactone hydrolase domain-containing protein n=1 Tax=Bifiguratus adelaidae TaxID=1938954 RepID=A0A261Y8K9_9FUNG|nr:hypothetical protein BZG36_00108 [Bifiguratus adelaidae]